MFRTNYCGRISESDIGKNITVSGFVSTKRDMGGVVFIDLYDREGVLQVVFNSENISADGFVIADSLKKQSVITVSGVVRLRDDDTINQKIATGTIELFADEIKLLSSANTLPFNIDDDDLAREDLRLKYRFLDLRRPKMLENLKFRHLVQKATQDFLDEREFINVETPMLTKSTPEGARDYLVPSRVHKGEFYALPQSPQIFKQLLMVGGIDRYYQVARCFRDEDLRADRQPEFTQVDMEMAFVTQEDVLVHLESMFKHILKATKGVVQDTPYTRITWLEAMDKYGSDKPDLRFDLPIVDLTKQLSKCEFSVFKSVIKSGGVVRAINIPDKHDFTRTQIEKLTEKAVSLGAKGMAWIAIKPDGEIYSILTKYFSKEEMDDLLATMNAKPGDFILFCADSLKTTRKTLGGVRLEVAQMLDLCKKDDYSILFVTEFPQFEWCDETETFIAMHHPFTMPRAEDIDYLETDLSKVFAQAYDVVLNGVELGSGSVRIFDKTVQEKMFKALGFSHQETYEKFGFMINAFSYGTPPHAGFAFGLDRLVMLLVGGDSLRDVIAFPKVKDASCPLTDAPSKVDDIQLLELELGAYQEKTSKTTEKTKTTTKIDVKNVANLARLNLSSDEEIRMETELLAIIDFANTLSEVDTSGIEISAMDQANVNAFRADISENNYNRDDLLANAKTKNDGYIFVPKVFE